MSRAPAPAAAAPPAPTRAEPGAPADTVAAQAAPAPRRAATIEPGSTYRVRPNDTLWQIASAAYPGTRREVNRAMLAVYQANPGAFGGNINVLRAGAELTMPSSGEVAAISASAAATEVARQYRVWSEGAAQAADASGDAGRLRLVTPDQGTAAPSTTTTAPAAAAVSGSSDQLQQRVQQLESELAEARRLLEVRNAELATLQGAAAPVETGEPVPSVPGEGEPAAEAPTAEAPTAETPVAEAAPPAAEPEETPQPAPAAAPEEPAPALLDTLRNAFH